MKSITTLSNFFINSVNNENSRLLKFFEMALNKLFIITMLFGIPATVLALIQLIFSH
ncbi:hypothetical protein [Cytobacillus horneckiae]|uniref:hypothetical protein n=1 Tax=Cytobacillus horneckiae TaxID=549687 RepID=UPI003D9A6FFC